MFNILKLVDNEEGFDYAIMLGLDVPELHVALHYLAQYRERYPDGAPFPNGEGFYRGIYLLCRFCEETAKYHVIQ